MKRGTWLGVAAWVATGAALAQAQPPSFPAVAMLRCQVTYAGSTQEVRAHPVDDPYTVPRVDIGGRFGFKPVVVGRGRQVDYIALYAYQDTRRQPILIQEAKYRPPFPLAARSGAPVPLTGEQHLYAGVVERELIYHCTLEGHAP